MEDLNEERKFFQGCLTDAFHKSQLDFRRDDNDVYISDEIQMSWTVWLQARAFSVRELLND